MRVLICGSRNWTDEETIENYIKTLPTYAVVIQGMCKGADMIARCLAKKHGHLVMDYPANWSKYGDAAGPIRNKRMLDKGGPDVVIAFHDHIQESQGTKNMIEQTMKRGIPYRVIPSMFSVCLTSDCEDNNREKGLCRLVAPKHGDKRECLSFVKDMKWLREDWWGR